MPKLKFDAKAESLQFELLPDGDYPFEVVAVDFSISKGRATAGSDVVELKLRFFSDKTFTKRRAQWTEDLIFHENCAWKVSVFTKCTNILVDGKVPPDGAELDYSESTMMGLRGWATVRTEEYEKNGQRKKANRVASFLTDREKLPRNTPPEDDGFGEATDGKPF